MNHFNEKDYRVREIGGKFHPERYDPDIGWISYRVYIEQLLFDDEESAWGHIRNNPDFLNVRCD